MLEDRHGSRDGLERLCAPAQTKQDPRALRSHALEAGAFGFLRGRPNRDRPIHPGQRLVMLLLQGQDLADVARDVPHAPVILAEKCHVLLERLAKRAFGVGMPAERRQRHGEIVGQIRHRQRAWAQHLPADGNGLSLQGLRLGIPLHGAEQRRVVVHQG